MQGLPSVSKHCKLFFDSGDGCNEHINKREDLHPFVIQQFET